MKFLGLLLIAFATTVYAETTMSVYGNITCEYEWFKFKIFILETDNLVHDELLRDGYNTVTSPHEYNYTFTDWSDASDNFEIHFRIFHNCTNENHASMLDMKKQDIGYFPNKAGGIFEKKFDICLTSQGEELKADDY